MDYTLDMLPIRKSENQKIQAFVPGKLRKIVCNLPASRLTTHHVQRNERNEHRKLKCSLAEAVAGSGAFSICWRMQEHHVLLPRTGLRCTLCTRPGKDTLNKLCWSVLLQKSQQISSSSVAG